MKIYYLEMLSAGKLNFKECPDSAFVINELLEKNFRVNKRMYSLVGKKWHWTDKMDWPDHKWKAHAERENLRTFLASRHKAAAGYYELLKENDEVEIYYLGLAQEFIGQGCGGYLLSRALRDAWSWQAKRVWVHTCDLDHPKALDNYKKRGMKLYKVEEK